MTAGRNFDKDTLLETQRRMLRIRLFDERASKMVKRGYIPGTVHTSIGQEAQVVGACMALAKGDHMTGNHRSHGHPIGMGSPLGPLMAELVGKATGVCQGKGGSLHLADYSVGSLGESGITGSAIPIAVGAALSAQVLGENRVSICFFGDGTANQGVLYESMNLASAFKLPIIFLCENNFYALSTPSHTVTGGRIVDRASGFGMPGVLVETGQSVMDVYDAVANAADRARREGKDVTVVGISGSLPLALKAAEHLAEQDIDAEVIDPRTLVPLDTKTIIESVKRTGRLVIAEPAHRTCGAAAEIAALVAEKAQPYLKAPIIRVTALDMQIPFSPSLEKLMYPTAETIADAIKKVCGRTEY